MRQLPVLLIAFTWAHITSLLLCGDERHLLKKKKTPECSYHIEILLGSQIDAKVQLVRTRPTNGTRDQSGGHILERRQIFDVTAR